MRAIEFGEKPIVKFCPKGAVKRILRATPSLLQNICRPIGLNRPIEDL
jgi:hypothetical protein